MDSADQPQGPSPVETLLASLGACGGMDVILILRKQRQVVLGYEVVLTGERRAEHPHSFTRIEVVHRLRGRDLNPAAIEEALRLGTATDAALMDRHRLWNLLVLELCPKRCRVKAWERRQSGSSNWLAAGEIRDAKSLKERWDFPKISRATSVVVERQRLNRLSSGSELNSATKLITHPPMQLMVRSGWTKSGSPM
jgi:hypothetical protein